MLVTADTPDLRQQLTERFAAQGIAEADATRYAEAVAGVTQQYATLQRLRARLAAIQTADQERLGGLNGRIPLFAIGPDGKNHLAGSTAGGGKAIIPGVTHLSHHEPGMAAGGSQHYETTDLHGQTMPFTRTQFADALAQIKPFSEQGLNKTGIATINGQEFFIKQMTNGLASEAEQSARNEAATVAMLQALQLGDVGPQAAYHLTSAGMQYAIISMERGMPVGYLDMAEERAASEQVSTATLARHLLATYVLGIGDRHAGNTLWDSATKTLREIDLESTFMPDLNPLIDHTAAETLWYNKVALSLGTYPLTKATASTMAGLRQHMAFPRALVEQTIAHFDHVQALAQHFDLYHQEQSYLTDRMEIVRSWLATSTGDPTEAGLYNAVSAWARGH